MRHHSQETAPSLYVQAAKDAFRKLDPRVLVRNPVMFVVAVGCVFTTASFFSRVVTGADAGFSGQISLWLWFTVLFANFAEALAEGRGKAQADTLRTLSGMKLATTVELTVNGEQLNVLIGEGQWSDKLGAGAVGLFLLWPLAITAGIGVYKQKMLPEEIFDVVRRNTMPGTSTEAEAPAAEKRICPQCHAENSCDARFCNACGAKLTLMCPQCGAPLAAGSRFCSQCGQPLG